MIADTVRLIRQCQKDHMGQYLQHLVSYIHSVNGLAAFWYIS